jgi:hypothetical protein
VGFVLDVSRKSVLEAELIHDCVFCLSLPKMLSGANAFEISDIERMNIGAHQPGV